MSELIRKVNTYNKRSTVFTSLYAFDKVNKANTRGVYSSARIKQIFFDFDKPQTITPIQQLHKYLLENDYRHCMFWSGGGVHFYVATKYPNQLKNKKGAVTNAQIDMADKTGLTIGINNEADIDGHVIGNIAQLVRVPGSFNLKRGRYCIPLKKSDLTSIDNIQKKSKKQRFGIYVYGKKFLDLAPFDTEPVTRNYELSILEQQGEIGVDKLNIENFPPCIKRLTTEKYIGHRKRYIFILYCKELGLPITDTIALLKKFLDPKTLYHCLRQEKQPYWVYRRNDLVFPSCEKLKQEGICPDEKCKGPKLYD